ncbi:bifunctional Phosphoglycerate kinase superfamily/Phosphoglycerate kinase/Phosphoglycerate kinase [Babesia duncani]|uniref:Phosphoglycerate kinase n=1 Tax=Babesia duncani TaxID=323732 RepID=A0AAD9PLJ5_9APIC|nr:bifunctional Phosphoglycerate kinase superfamily/Phosphoglycerate kinase/Phosphoglycerate kinase [Babesia duncani]
MSTLSEKLGLADIVSELPGKRVVVRVDYNVPLGDGKVLDATRVKATIPTINFLLEHNVKTIILISHCGRPDGEKNPKYSLRPVADVLSSLLDGRRIEFIDDCIGERVENACNNAGDKTIFLLENLRFYAEEEGVKNDVKVDKELVDKFRAQLTKLGDIYVNDAFGTAHRAHSSIVGIDLPLKVAGFLMKKELDYFSKALENPTRPLLSILGGAKVRDKIQLITALLEKANMLFIGGGMAYTFKHVNEGMEIGTSLFDEEGKHIVKEVIEKAKQKGVELYFPVDFKITTEFSNTTPVQIVTDKEGIPPTHMGLDCGPKTLELLKSVVARAKTIVWNGPLGVSEMSNFAEGSVGALDIVGEATAAGAISIIGGGDTAALAETNNRSHLFSHVSTGGGAALKLMEGKVLPGVDALSTRK